MANTAPRLRIGTAGWSIPAASRAQFPAVGHALQRYATRMNAVEINSSFYRQHPASTYAKWASLVPAGFRFSVKLPRTITQFARLRDVDALLDTFMDEVRGLGRKLGRLLVQLPPSLPFDPSIADAFITGLRNRAGRTGIACEPRHASWGHPEAEALLLAHRVARVAADPPRFGSDAQPGGARPPYYRLHGSPRLYFDAYGQSRLLALAEQLRGQRDAWVIFDNTAHGHALADALCLEGMLGISPPHDAGAAKLAHPLAGAPPWPMS